VYGAGCGRRGSATRRQSRRVAIDAYPAQKMRELNIPGWLSASCTKTRLPLQGFGVADASGRMVTPQTRSSSLRGPSPFTALAIMQLVEDRKLDLDAHAFTYLPSF
jgi:CubicO group peptidase (beta-lactamase class C family)